MNTLRSIFKNEQGSPLVVVLLVLVLLSVIGMAVINTSSVDTEMAGQHRRHKIAFYGADGGTHIACELLEQNIGCPTGFTANSGANAVIGAAPPVPGCPSVAGDMPAVMVSDLTFWQNLTATEPTNVATSHLFYPANYTDLCSAWPHTLITAGGDTRPATGSGLQELGGYESKGKGIAGGGAHILYVIFSRRIESTDESTIMIGWRHTVGQEGGCNY